jgi:hypothetical protein
MAASHHFPAATAANAQACYWPRNVELPVSFGFMVQIFLREPQGGRKGRKAASRRGRHCWAIE